MRQVREQVALFTPVGPQGIQLWANNATQELAALTQEFGFRLNRVAPLDGSENFTSQVTFEAGIKILDSTGADSVVFSHDGTDFNSAFTNTTDWNIGGLSGGILVRDGAFLQIMDATDANAIRMSHDGADFNVIDQAGTTNMNITGMNVVVAENLVVDHNGNTGGVSSGTYTPTLTNNTNIAASTAFECQWLRVGNVVAVSGQVNIDPIDADTASSLLMSIPIAASFSAPRNLAGVAAGATGEIASPRAATTTDEANFIFTPPGAGNIAYIFSFMYDI